MKGLSPSWTTGTQRPRHAAARRVSIALAVGIVIGGLAATVVAWQAAPLLGWDAAAAVFLALVWSAIGGLDATSTAAAAALEDPSVGVADLVIVIAGVACLGAVGLALIKAGSSTGAAKALLIAIGVVSVALSWAAVHTVFTLRYARLYFGRGDEGISFNEKAPPDYLDFAYVAFTVGLTYQVSDTSLSSKPIRRLALRHAVLSFLFGAVIIGLTINVVASLLH